MFKIIDSDEVTSNDSIRKKYIGYMILTIKSDVRNGKVYAIADGNDIDKITQLQMDLYDKGIETRQVNSLAGNNGTLVVRKCEVV